MKENEIIPHLFKTEYSKMVAVLTKSFGLEFIEIAEDIVSETFLSAMYVWTYQEMPANPKAWLYTVAKNKLKNQLSRKKLFDQKVSIFWQVSQETELSEPEFSDQNISDSQLQMIFAVCHPSIPPVSQICLALHILCGLGIQEIADALLSNKETIQKRLQRAKEKLRAEQVKLEFPENSAIAERLEAVLKTIYLLFSEGYYSESHPSIIREELCIEAINLAYLLICNPLTNTHATNSLLSLMCFQASRLASRRSQTGEMILFDQQDRSLWDSSLVEKGFYYLQQASQWEISSPYYLEASIAYWHTVDHDDVEKWSSILRLYDALMLSKPNSVIALNRLWAFSKVYGPQAAIEESIKLSDKSTHFYHILMAELYRETEPTQCKNHLKKALDKAKTKKEKDSISKSLQALEEKQ